MNLFRISHFDLYYLYSNSTEKVLAKEKVFFDSVVSSQKPFGLRTYVTPLETGDIILKYNKGKGCKCYGRSKRMASSHSVRRTV